MDPRVSRIPFIPPSPLIKALTPSNAVAKPFDKSIKNSSFKRAL
jgi:hypothetical protein